jgi:DNA invertase Pin-like site-specific DNA recombinase
LEETGITLYFSELFGDMPVVMPKNPEEVGLKKKFNMARQMSEMVISMMASFAEMEKEMILERTSTGKIAWAEKGYSIGGEAPFGYTKEYEEIGSRRHTKLVPLPEEQEVLKTIYACKKRGLGWRRTAKQVQSLHPEHANFTPYKVGKILKRKYQGLPETS